MGERLDGGHHLLVHQLQSSGQDPGGDDGTYRLGRLLDGEEVQQQGGH